MSRSSRGKRKSEENELETGSEPQEDEGPACQSCRKRKAKCTREQPCALCVRFGVECQYDESKTKPGVKAGVVESLSQRLDALEKMFIGQSLLMRQLLASTTQLTPLNMAVITPQPTGTAQQRITAEVACLKRDLMDAYSNSADIDNANPVPQKIRRQHSGNTGSPSTPNRMDGSSEAGDVRDNPTIRSRKRSITNFFDDPDLPPFDLMQQLVAIYFNTIHPWIPVIHQQCLLRKLDSPAERDQLSTILCAITVVTVRFSSDPRLEQQETRERLSKICRQNVILKCMENFSVENLQALIIVAFDTIGSGRGPKSWAIVDCMSRQVEHLQLSFEDDFTEQQGQSYGTANGASHRMIHRLSFLGKPRNWVESEERRRVFWNVFLLDRFCSVSTGWNPGLTSADARRRLPCEGAIWEAEKPVKTRYFGIGDSSQPGGLQRFDAPTNSTAQSPEEVASLGGFAYCIEATESLSQVTRFFLQQAVNPQNIEDVQHWLMRFKELDFALVKWKLSLPPQWREATVRDAEPRMDPNLTLAHITHNTSVILLHQGIAFPTAQWQASAMKLPQASSVDTCVSAATEISTITQQYLIHNAGITNPHFAFCLFVAGRSLLAHSTYYRLELLPEFHLLVKSLLELSNRWQGVYVTENGSDNLASRFARNLLNAQTQASAKHNGVDLRQPAYSSDTNHTTTTGTMNGCSGYLELDNQYIPASEPLSLASPPMPLAFQTDTAFYENFMQSSNSPGSMHQQHVQMEAGLSAEQMAQISNLFADPQFLELDRVLMYNGGPL